MTSFIRSVTYCSRFWYSSSQELA